MRAPCARAVSSFDRGASEYDHVVLATGYRIDIARLNSGRRILFGNNITQRQSIYPLTI